MRTSILLLAACLAVAGCETAGRAQTEMAPTVKMLISEVPFEVAGNADVGGTGTGADAKPLEEVWQEGDSVAVWADTVALSYYHLIAGAGKGMGVFEGPALKDSVTYYASMPGRMPGDTLRGKLEGNAFVLEHSSSFMRLSFSIPDGKRGTAIGLMPMSVQPIVFAQNLDSLGGKAELLVAFAPSDWSADAFAAILVLADNSMATSRLPGMEFRPGHGVEYRFDPVVGVYGEESSAIGITDKGQARLLVSSGQYSGITYIGDNRYAVVHDKSSGGGIHLFDIALDASGGFVSAIGAEAPGNASQGAGKDNEGIVYLPESGTLLVSAESDQSISEYSLEGNPTGRSVAVPADLKAIQSNAGFEALGYSPATGLIWAVTEKPLKGDDSVLRLQSFSDKTLEPAGRYLYIPHRPIVSGELAATAQAYVFGIPAVTALDDGRLIVLEREVYVPGGNYIQKAMGSFTRINLFEVDPVHDTAGILQKRLLASFATGALNLANFEGMCLGPVLPDGSQSLLLIADSQGGQGGLTGEYLRIFTLRP